MADDHVYPGVNEHLFRGWCFDLSPGVYFQLKGLPHGDSFEIVDYTVGATRGRSWTIRYDHIDEDFAEFWDDFMLMRELRPVKPMGTEQATGHWVHGEDGMSEWVSFKGENKDDPQAD